jgi:hypothetical protein
MEWKYAVEIGNVRKMKKSTQFDELSVLLPSMEMKYEFGKIFDDEISMTSKLDLSLLLFHLLILCLYFIY